MNYQMFILYTKSTLPENVVLNVTNQCLVAFWFTKIRPKNTFQIMTKIIKFDVNTPF